MSFKAIFQLFLQVHHFENVELPSQGLCQLRASIYHEENANNKIYGSPYEFIHKNDGPVANSKKIKTLGFIQEPYFYTKVGIIKYSDEKIILNDFSRFRLEVQAFQNDYLGNIFIEFQLLFTESYFLSPNVNFEGDIVATKKYRLKKIEEGIFNYYQGQFGQNYDSKFGFTLFGCLSRFQFRKFQAINEVFEQTLQGQIKPQINQTVSRKISKRNKQRSQIKSLSEMLKWIQKQFQVKDPKADFYEAYVKNLRKFFYLAQQLFNKKSLIIHEIILEVPSDFLPQTKAKKQQFYAYIKNYRPQKLTAERIIQQINQIFQKIFAFLWNTVQKQFSEGNLRQKIMKQQFIDYMKQRYGERVFKSQVDRLKNSVVSQNQKVAKIMRSKDNIMLTAYPIEDVSFVDNKNALEYIFYQITPSKQQQNKKKQLIQDKKTFQISQKSFSSFQSQSQNSDLLKIQKQSSIVFSDGSDIQAPNSNQSKQQDQQISPLKDYKQTDMLIVMCHGFQGSSYDMAVILKAVQSIFPAATFLISKRNQGKTEQSIQKMGERLAEQINTHIINYLDKDKVIINLIGHSMGGIIARAGLKHLPSCYSNRLGFFCSFSSPHLGYLNGVQKKIKIGLWAIQKLKPVTSLMEFTMDDNKDKRKTFMYKLSKQGNLKNFRKIILFSSFQDSYVSWHSARISPHTNKNNNLDTKIQKQMVQNILGCQSIHRIDVNFNIKSKNLDSFIGRTAHINLIIQPSFLNIINYTIPNLFKLQST